MIPVPAVQYIFGCDTGDGNCRPREVYARPGPCVSCRAPVAQVIACATIVAVGVAAIVVANIAIRVVSRWRLHLDPISTRELISTKS